MLVNSIDDNLNAFEEIAGVQSVEGRKTGKDICSEIADCVTTKLHIDFKNLVEVCTDGAPAMCIKRSGATDAGAYWKKSNHLPLHHTSTRAMQQGFET